MTMTNPNTITAVIPKLIGMSTPVLRANSIMPRLVNTDISEDARAEGNTVDVPIPPDFAAQDVSPTNHFPDPQGATDVTVPVALDRWKHVTFHLTDKERKEIVVGNVMPQRFVAAVKALADEVDTYLLSLYTDFYGFYRPTSGIPFSNKEPIDATQIRAVLNNQYAPTNPRHLVLHPSTEAYALAVPAFASAEWSGDPTAIIEGKMNMRVGFNFWMNQNMPTHTAGAVTTDWTVSGPLAIGVSTIPLTGASGVGNYAVGDIVTFAGHTQTYTVLSQVAGTSITVRPPLVAAVADAADITQAASHIVNLAFHPQAYAFATRPMEPPEAGLGVISRTIVDDLSGLSMRLQVRYANFVTIWSVDILYGGAVVRPELGARLAHDA